MAVFPLFIDLKGRKCVVIGGGKVAARKVEILLEFQAEIHIVSPQASESIHELRQRGAVYYYEREYSESDLEGAFMAIAATSDKRVNDRIAEDAAKLKIFVNVVDDPEKCTFVFPSVVKKSDFVAGVSTSGSYPALSKNIRKKLERMLINIDENSMALLRSYRRRAILKIENEAKRKECLNRLLDEVVLSGKEMENRELELEMERIFGEHEK